MISQFEHQTHFFSITVKEYSELHCGWHWHCYQSDCFLKLHRSTREDFNCLLVKWQINETAVSNPERHADAGKIENTPDRMSVHEQAIRGADSPNCMFSDCGQKLPQTWSMKTLQTKSQCRNQILTPESTTLQILGIPAVRRKITSHVNFCTYSLEIINLLHWQLS